MRRYLLPTSQDDPTGSHKNHIREVNKGNLLGQEGHRKHVWEGTLVVQWFIFCTSNTGRGHGSILVVGTKIPNTSRSGQKVM